MGSASQREVCLSNFLQELQMPSAVISICRDDQSLPLGIGKRMSSCRPFVVCLSKCLIKTILFVDDFEGYRSIAHIVLQAERGRMIWSAGSRSRPRHSRRSCSPRPPLPRTGDCPRRRANISRHLPPASGRPYGRSCSPSPVRGCAKGCYANVL